MHFHDWFPIVSPFLKKSGCCFSGLTFILNYGDGKITEQALWHHNLSYVLLYLSCYVACKYITAESHHSNALHILTFASLVLSQTLGCMNVNISFSWRAHCCSESYNSFICQVTAIVRGSCFNKANKAIRRPFRP